MAHLRCVVDEEEANGGRKGVYVSRCVVLSVALFNILLIATCVSLLLLLRGTSPGVEVHRVRRQVENGASSTAPMEPVSSTRPKRLTPVQTLSTAASRSSSLSLLSSSSSTTTTTTTTTISSNRTEPIEDDYSRDDLRLASELQPFHYDIHWRPDIYHPTPDLFTLNATAIIYLRCHSPSAVISLNYRHLVFDSFSFEVKDLKDNSTISIVKICADLITEDYNITMERSLAVGEEVALTMKYTAYIQDDSMGDTGDQGSTRPIGVFRTKYSTRNSTRYALFTQMKTTEARRTFPCVDDPEMKATFTLSIDRQQQLRTLSNAPLDYTVSTDADGGNSSWVTDVFQTTKPMSTYLVAFTVSDYTNVTVYSVGCNNITINLWAQDDFVRAGYLDYASAIVPEVLDFYEDYFDYSYNWPKLDIGSIPGKRFGSSENWGLIFYQSNYILFDQSQSDNVDKLNIVSFVSQMILKSWIGNTVTIKWWDDLWLTEAMARYLQCLGIQSVYPTWDIAQVFVTDTFYVGGMWIEDFGSGTSVYNSNLTTFADLDKQFDDVALNKGAAVIRMLSNLIVGEDVFQMALQQYILDFQYSNVDHNDFLAELTKVYNESVGDMDFNVTEVLLTWIMQAEYPLVTISLGENGTHVTMSQSVYIYRYNFTADDLNPSPYGYLWEIPITYITSYDPQPIKVWMHKERQISAPLTPSMTVNDWILVNHNLYGYYRVNYDDANWKSLTAQLKSDHTKIPVNNRAQLIDDSFTYSMSGAELMQTVGLKITEYLTNETEYLPWKRFQDCIEYLLLRIADDHTMYERMQNYISSRLQDNYKIFGWETPSNDSITTAFLRRLIIELACSTQDDDCVTTATSRFRVWKANGFNNTAVTPDQRFAVYCTVSANGSYDDWQLLVSRYQATVDSFTGESEALAKALTCTGNTTLISSLLQKVQNQETDVVAPQDYGRVVQSISLSIQGYNASWDHLMRYGLQAFGRIDILNSFSLIISTPTEEARFQSYVNQFPPQNADEREKFSSFWQIIRQNSVWRQRNLQDISDWLTSLGF